MNEQELQIIAEYSDHYIDRYSVVKEIEDLDTLEYIAVSDENVFVRKIALERIKQIYPKKAEVMLKEIERTHFQIPDNGYHRDLDFVEREELRRKDKKEYNLTLRRIQKKSE